MRLYIKTPFYENNKYIPHLLEHCVLFSPEIKHFLYTYNEVYAYASTGYTTFEFDNATPLESLVKTIQNAITPANIPLQKKILKSEYENSSSGQKLYEKTLQKIMKNPNIKTNGCQKVSMKEIIQYHKKWYQKEHMIVFDEASTNILNRGGGKKLEKDPMIGKLSQIQYSTINYHKDGYDLIFTAYHSPYDILFLDFFESLINVSIFYTTTMKGATYSDPIDISLTDKMYILMIDKGMLPKKITKDFFDQFKGYFLKQIGQNKMRSFIPHIAMFTGYFISIEQHKKYIETIDIKVIESILSHITK